jgi:PAS domain S-box-containing protein
VRPRQIAAITLVLVLTVAGFIVARVVTERAARHDSEHSAEVAAAQIRGRVAQAASLTQSLSQYMLNASGTGVTSDQFARNALRWLTPAGFPAAAWVEQVSDSRRAGYERRLGQPVVTPDERHEIVPAGARSSYVPATLVSGFPPMAAPGTDLSGVPGMPATLAGASRLDRVAATPVAPPRTGTHGLFLVAPAPNLTGEALRSGYVVVFVSDATLRAAATYAPSAQIPAGGTSTDGRAETAGKTFTVAGQRFEVVVPEESVQGAAAVLPWLILAAGLLLAGLAAALGVSAGRRARAQEELDRIFTLSPDLIAVADFHGHFTRVNPAVEQVLGYTQEEFLARPYLDLVHPDDRESTAAEAAAIGEGKRTLSFENRYVRKDGSERVLEWTSTPVVGDGLMYGVARDVTERREAERQLEGLAEERAALERVATLVAEGVQPAELFSAVTQEVARLFDEEPSLVPSIVRFDPGPEFVLVGTSKPQHKLPLGSRWGPKDLYVSTRVLRTGRPARVEEKELASLGGPDAELLRSQGFLHQVGSPIVVEGRPWGAMTMNSAGALPPDTAERLDKFTELVATAISNAESREALARLAEEQAALRRVATLVAEDVPSRELFEAAAREVGTLLGGDFAGMARFENDEVVTVGVWAAEGEHPPVPPRWQMQPGDPATRIAETREAARWNDWTDVPGPIAEFIRGLGIRSTVGTPIVVEGRLWGAFAVHSKQGVPLPPDTESRMAQFTDLLGTAVANREARAEVTRLADEQAALRRVATVVAGGASQAEVFSAIARECGQLFGTEDIAMARYEGDRGRVIVASSGKFTEGWPVGSRQPLGGDNAGSRVLRTRRPVRIDDYGSASGPIGETGRSIGIRSVVATPIMGTEGRLWGTLTIGTSQDEPLPPDSEARLGQFTELMATAIARTESRAEVERLAEEQAALRRVATLVAEGAPSTAVFDAVAAEMEGLLGADRVSLSRYEPGAEIAVLAHRGSGAELVPTGSRLSLEGDSVQEMVRRTGRPARMENFEEAHGPIAEVQRTMGVRGVVGVPVVVDGRVWGVIGASWVGEESPPVDTEERMAQFAGLLETAIANADSRGQLDASRARLVTEADEARRRLVRDLHDGAQQRMVHTIVTLKLAERALGRHDGEARQLVGDALEHAEQSNRELRELAHGILPAVLDRGGLRAGVGAFVGRLDLPVGLDVPAERFPAEIEASAYFIVAEALTNVVKHAHAEHAEVTVSVQNGVLHVQVRDDGIGGADPDGHGLVGLGDRATALGGRLQIESAPGDGTLLAATLPLPTG